MQCYDSGDVPGVWLDNFLQIKGSRLLYAPPQLDKQRSVKDGNIKFREWTKIAKEDDKVNIILCFYLWFTISEFIWNIYERSVS